MRQLMQIMHDNGSRPRSMNTAGIVMINIVIAYLCGMLINNSVSSILLFFMHMAFFNNFIGDWWYLSKKKNTRDQKRKKCCLVKLVSAKHIDLAAKRSSTNKQINSKQIFLLLSKTPYCTHGIK